MVQQRRAVDTERYRRRYRLWLLILVWLVAMTIVGVWRVIHEEDRRRQERIEERFTICREDEIIKRILRDDLNEQILQEEAVLRDPSILPDYLEEATRLSLARHRRQRLLLAARDCDKYARETVAGVRPPDTR